MEEPGLLTKAGVGVGDANPVTQLLARRVSTGQLWILMVMIMIIISGGITPKMVLLAQSTRLGRYMVITSRRTQLDSVG